MVALVLLAEELPGRRLAAVHPEAPAGLATAYVLALAIGLHNFGEGLAVGTATAVGEVAFGTTLLLGFVIHTAPRAWPSRCR